MTDTTVSPDSAVFTVGPTWRAIGLEMTTESRADEVLAQASDKCTPVVGDMDKGVFHYEDRSGAVAVFDVVEEKIVDIHQDFNAQAEVLAQWVEMADRYILADLQGSNGETVGQACVALRGGLLNEAGRGGSGKLGLAALGGRVELYDGPLSYAASETAKIFAEATQGDAKDPKETLPTFISTGAVSVLQKQGAHAGAVMSGKIEAAEMHSNTLTGENFWVLEVNVGFPLSVCVGEDDVSGRPRAGQVVAGEFLVLATAR